MPPPKTPSLLDAGEESCLQKHASWHSLNQLDTNSFLLSIPFFLSLNLSHITTPTQKVKKQKPLTMPIIPCIYLRYP
jgi:hypothetical protein